MSYVNSQLYNYDLPEVQYFKKYYRDNILDVCYNVGKLLYDILVKLGRNEWASAELFKEYCLAVNWLCSEIIILNAIDTNTFNSPFFLSTLLALLFSQKTLCVFISQLFFNCFTKLYLIIGAIILVVGCALMPALPYLAKDYQNLDVNLYLTFALMLASVVLSYVYSSK